MLEFEGTYDGEVIRPDGPLDIRPDTRVRFTAELVFEPIEPVKSATDAPYSFLDVCLAANLEGPPDWSENINKYLSGELDLPE